MMIVLRLVVVFIFTALLAGCGLLDDIKALKTDIRAMRIYLMALPAPEQCRGPGVYESTQSCYYKLLITEDKDKGTGLFKGRIAPEVYEENVKDCEKAKGDLRPEYQDLPYDCRIPKEFPGKDIEYGFQVDGNPKLIKGETYPFMSVPGSNYLKKLEKEPEKDS